MCATAPLQELKRCLVSMTSTGCFAPATFLVQPRGGTRCPRVFSIFSFYNCGINVQIETSLLVMLLAFGRGDSKTGEAPVPSHRRPRNARLRRHMHVFGLVHSSTKYAERMGIRKQKHLHMRKTLQGKFKEINKQLKKKHTFHRSLKTALSSSFSNSTNTAKTQQWKGQVWS